jgi:2-amino-4-hydroxy-6-hydroxymethyldihydropteridine diphosphokinase
VVRVFLGLGSNQGDRRENLARALQLLGKEITIVRTSSIYETEPVGYLDQDWFLNAVCQAQTDRGPRDLLELANRVEQALGRVRDIHWGPRTLDVDILLYGDRIVDEPDLQIPHPRLAERGFVLTPLSELAGELIHPTLGLTIAELRYRLADSSEVRVTEYTFSVGATGSRL